MTDVTDQTVVGSMCMFYRRQSRGVLLKNSCSETMVFAVEQRASSSTQSIINNIPVGGNQEVFHGTGGSDNVIAVRIGS